tara:strand:- start:62 stop:247 length:186 start_codon:yes stop_codon:yes gene_type:complete
MIKLRRKKRNHGIHRGVYLDKNVVDQINILSKEHSISGNEIIRQSLKIGLKSKKLLENLPC